MINRLPPWFKQEISAPASWENARLLSRFQLRTVCQEAHCPNLASCFGRSQLTFMILGDVCTRDCRFCGVAEKNTVLFPPDPDEPRRIAEVARILALRYLVATSVTRDDLEDGGAGHFAQVIAAVRSVDSQIKVEVLIPDFKGDILALKKVLAAKPTLLGHNLETVKRLHAQLKPLADYQRSLELLRQIKTRDSELPVKSSLMLGLGESEEEVIEAMRELKEAGCDILTLGQYLPPSPKHYPVQEFIRLEKFKDYERIGKELGFRLVVAGPLVRSSYQAEDVYASL